MYLSYCCSTSCTLIPPRHFSTIILFRLIRWKKKKKEEAEGIQIFVQCQSQDSFMVTVVSVLSKFIRHVTLSANVCV